MPTTFSSLPSMDRMCIAYLTAAGGASRVAASITVVTTLSQNRWSMVSVHNSGEG